MHKNRFPIFAMLFALSLLLAYAGFSQQNTAFTFKKGMKLHYNGFFEINSRVGGPAPFVHDTIKDFVVTVDTCITSGALEYIKLHTSGYTYYDKKTKEQINILFCNEEGNDLLLYKGQFFQLKTSDGFYKKYMGEDNLLKKMMDSTALQDELTDITVSAFIDPSNTKNCDTYKKNTDRDLRSMAGEFYCLNHDDNLAYPYGGNVRVFEKRNFNSLLAPTSYYYYSKHFFMSKFIRDFNISATKRAYYELTLIDRCNI